MNISSQFLQYLQIKGRLLIEKKTCPPLLEDRDRKFSEWPAEFSVISSDNSKNFLLKKFLKILQNARAHQLFRQ